jgi:pimeloyl-ACP methyl ester carboxylesterase
MVDLDRLAWYAAEAPRFAMQLGRTLLELPDRHTLNTGDGHPVVFIPGFMTGNSSLYFLRRVLKDRDHKCIRWSQNQNLGITEDIVEKTAHQINEIAWETGQTVSLVGQSLGGSIARVVANEVPDAVRSVITLGSPINGLAGVLDKVKQLYDLRTVGTKGAIEAWESFYTQVVNNPPMPSTSIYSKNDGIVQWGESLVIETDNSENVEVNSSHLCMGFDIDVMRIVANRLSQPEGQWTKYACINKGDDYENR